MPKLLTMVPVLKTMVVPAGNATVIVSVWERVSVRVKVNLIV